MTAAEQNGYIADHSAATARAAIRSGLRNGLRSPRPLPEFGRRQMSAGQVPREQRARRKPGSSTAAPPKSTGRGPAASRARDAASSTCLSAASSREAPDFGQVSASKGTESVEPEDLAPASRCQTGFSDGRESIVRKEREELERVRLPNVEVDEPAAAGRVITTRGASNGSPDWRDAVIDKQRQAWQPQVTQPNGPAVRPVEATGQQVST